MRYALAWWQFEWTHSLISNLSVDEHWNELNFRIFAFDFDRQLLRLAIMKLNALIFVFVFLFWLRLFLAKSYGVVLQFPVLFLFWQAIQIYIYIVYMYINRWTHSTKFKAQNPFGLFCKSVASTCVHHISIVIYFNIGMFALRSKPVG